MARIQVKLVNTANFARIKLAHDQSEVAKELLNDNGYYILPAFNITQTGEAAAEEIFDLTNNPSREDERLDTYGNGRSLSDGDIVCVNGVDYLCASVGWRKL